ncbi:hypothetical protein L3Y34_019542 [Caenorhabditis briggsae]|uniref:Galectin domain-containing protein n=1 Tax=Caenorhabditis briggsae TaxID=6238 RepID=A0AAE9DN17_CAEBR|nr:hypothetical protein L3Y34_019542 [Caenorhabditis briggsae]
MWGAIMRPLSSTLNSKKRIYDIEERRYFFLEQETFIRVSIVIHSTYFEITVNNYWTKLYEFRMSPERSSGDGAREHVATIHRSDLPEEGRNKLKIRPEEESILFNAFVREQLDFEERRRGFLFITVNDEWIKYFEHFSSL